MSGEGAAELVAMQMGVIDAGENSAVGCINRDSAGHSELMRVGLLDDSVDDAIFDRDSENSLAERSQIGIDDDGPLRHACMLA